MRDSKRATCTFDTEIFNKALNAYANDPNKNLQNFYAYAKKLRVHKKVTELMDVLLNYEQS